MSQVTSRGAAARRTFEGEPVATGDLAERISEIDRAIAERAYEIFEERGYAHGNDLEDWLRAEAEMLEPLACDLNESGDAITVAVPVRGFAQRELGVNLAPRRVIVCGKRDERTRGKRMLRAVVELPAEIDPPGAKAQLRGEVLSVVLPKTKAS